jgi:hypothetical protein
MATLLNHPWLLFLVSLALFAFAFGCGELYSHTVRLSTDEDRYQQVVHVRDSLLILISLLLGFTVAMAITRYDQRRQVVVRAANAIGTTYLRTSFVPEPDRLRAQQLLREYVDSRIQFFGVSLDEAAVERVTAESKQLQNQLWEICTRLGLNQRDAVSATFISTLNEMIDLEAERRATSEDRIPHPVWFLIMVISVLAAFSAGLAQRTRFPFILIITTLMLAVPIALIAELDSPRSGLIQTDQRTLLRLQRDLRAH